MSIGLTARELAQMQADINDLLESTNTTCDILSVAYTADGEGGMAETWGTATANVACRIDYRSGSEKMTGGAIQSYSKAVISLPYTTAITTKHRIKLDDYVWSVLSVNEGQSWDVVRRAELERVE
jgi:SPP1 family predicted phage head-tail adaptor